MKLIFLFTILFGTIETFSQNESYINEIFGEKKPFQIQEIEAPVKWQVTSDVYKIDLNNDNFAEGVQFVKKDGQNFFYLYDTNGYVLMKEKMQTLGINSHVYKFRIKKIRDDVVGILIYFYTGHTQKIKTEGLSYLYLASINIKDFSKKSFMRGPPIFREYQNKDFYSKRYYFLKFDDLDADGSQDLVVYLDHTKYVYWIDKNSRWKTSD